MQYFGNNTKVMNSLFTDLKIETIIIKWKVKK